MEQKIKTLLLINFVWIIVLPWTCHFNSNIIIFDISLDKYSKNRKKLVKRDYRLLGKYKHSMNSKVTCTRQEIPNTSFNNKNDICNNEKEVKTKVKESNRSSQGNT
ncbi:fam-l protein [Plasmodium brasilianum]|uniref:Fam-l protein n=1 Tax=Plasmodium brasilianum TaxID=5824 RepID=A0ACB9Y809_PLABR|nr:fam-l protein [Plasmodium brasilianum]